MTGHLLGAAGGIESIFTAVQENIIPPTINLIDQDPACDLTTANRRRKESQSRP